MTDKEKIKKMLDVDIVKAILELCGVSYGESYWDGGWTRVVRVKGVDGKERAIVCDRWGARAVMVR